MLTLYGDNMNQCKLTLHFDDIWDQAPHITVYRFLLKASVVTGHTGVNNQRVPHVQNHGRPRGLASKLCTVLSDVYDQCVKWISPFIGAMCDKARIIVQYCMGHVHPGRICPSPSVDMPPRVDMPHDTNTTQWLIKLVSIYYKIIQLLLLNQEFLSTLTAR